MGALAVALFFVASAAHADIYVWTDAKGVEHYSSTPPDDSSAKKKPKVFKSDKKVTGSPAGRPAGDAAAPAAGEVAARRRVELYTTSWCPICASARAYLNARGIAFQDFDVEKDRQAHSRYAGYGGHGVPLAVIDGAVVTGFDAANYDRLLKP